MNRARASFAAALVADLLGAAGVLLFAGRVWQRVSVTRVRPLPDAAAKLTGRDLYPALTAFALIALVGVIAIAATRGWGRRAVGLALAASGVVIGWYAVRGFSAVSPGRARSSIESGVGIDSSSVPHVVVEAGWAGLTLASAVLIVAAGALTVLNARRWTGLASRYDAPTAGARTARANQSGGDIALWSALDRGDDPTTRTES